MEKKTNKKADMTANDLYSILAKRTNHTSNDIKIILTEFASIIRDSVARDGGCIIFPQLGKFVRTYRKAFVGRNPNTGEAKEIEASAGVRFLPSQGLKQIAKFNAN